MSRLAIVAALEREVRPLVRHWRVNEREHDGRRYRFYEGSQAVLVCGGIGPEAARRAAEAAIVLYTPDVVYSVGYAGALDPALKVGDFLIPRRVINLGDGSSTEIAKGNGTLVTQGLAATAAQKSKLRESYAADAVDMEASGVAHAAETRGISFSALKVISDEFEFELPPIARFVDTEGHFREARFALFVAVRPWLWPRVIQLASNSARATRILRGELQKILLQEVLPTLPHHPLGVDKKSDL